MKKRENWVPKNDQEFSEYLIQLKEKRYALKEVRKKEGIKRKNPPISWRKEILKKTDGRCHVCGSKVSGKEMNADHVKSHSKGGAHEVSNYLAACGTCNNYRWDYLSEEMKEILKLGVWAAEEMRKPSRFGRQISQEFIKKELVRINRRKKSP